MTHKIGRFQITLLVAGYILVVLMSLLLWSVGLPDKIPIAVVIVTIPLSFFGATTLAIFQHKAAAIWLIIDGLVVGVFSYISYPRIENFLDILAIIVWSVPQMILGSLWLLQRRTIKPIESANDVMRSIMTMTNANYCRTCGKALTGHADILSKLWSKNF